MPKGGECKSVLDGPEAEDLESAPARPARGEPVPWMPVPNGTALDGDPVPLPAKESCDTIRCDAVDFAAELVP